MIRYRLSTSPTRPLPLNVRSAGHYRLPPGHRETRVPGNFFQVFWTVSGNGRFNVAGRFMEVPSGGLFYYAPGEAHEIFAGPAGWDYRWLTLDGPDSRRIVARHGLQRVQTGPACPEPLFERLDLALSDPTPDGERRASVLAYEILLRSGDRAAAVQPAGMGAHDAEVVRAWIDTHFADARLNVAALAEKFGLHRSTLHRAFVGGNGVAPVRYLARLRLRRGLELLAGTCLPVAEVAVRCGIPDVAYFSKLVSRHTGYSPRDYRRRQASVAQGAGMVSGSAESPSMS